MRDALTRTSLALILVTSALTACGGGDLTLADYAADVEQMVERKAWQMEALEAEPSSLPEGLERTQSYWSGRADAGVELLEELRMLEPPEEIGDFHAATLDIMTRYVAAEEGYAVRAGAAATVSELDLSGEAEEVRVVEDDIRAICRTAQATFDDTGRREVLSGVPWIPTELQDVIHVAFRCSTEAVP